MSALPVAESGGAARLDLVPEAVRDEHGTLRMTLRGAEDWVDAFADAPIRLAKAADDVARDVGVGESSEPHGNSLAVQRAIPFLEQLAHKPRLGPGEDKRGYLALKLDMAPDDCVHLLDLRDVLELVEHDQRAEPAAFLETQRKIQKGVERRQWVRSRIKLQLRADPESAERQAESCALEELFNPGA